MSPVNWGVHSEPLSEPCVAVTYMLVFVTTHAYAVTMCAPNIPTRHYGFTSVRHRTGKR